MSHRSAPGDKPLLLCFSHLRWGFVTQRPQHLLRRAAAQYHVVYWEEPLLDDHVEPRLDQFPQGDSDVTVVVPKLPHGMDEAAFEATQRQLLKDFLGGEQPAVTWFYTPMALGFADEVQGRITVYDCMDELSGFLGAPPTLLPREAELFRRADLVFTGGRSLYEAKRERHRSVHCFPSSIDTAHFSRARAEQPMPPDQAPIPRPQLGFFGVVDERMNLDLLRQVAALRPDWHFVMIGPVVKIDPETLPRPHNIHWLGGKHYNELPAYLAGWDAGFMPFALNEATRFISPTKTPEYLAAGVPPVSTPITDVVRPWGEDGLVEIAGSAEEAAAALDRAAAHRRDPAWLARVDETLRHQSWDKTWAEMQSLIQQAAAQQGHA
ncbi:glycosyltransferase [Roseomonas elaeocarpi]|uniref:Glycosyltransferase n=1 Tax=Roseomonas elaeocarpi TaxID=907779 RepID=A0ABV6JXD0_9PROT